jgi:hypothetical protein
MRLYNFVKKIFSVLELGAVPAFIKTASNIEVNENSPAEFSVTVKGEPAPNVEWMHENQLIKDSFNFSVSNWRI